MRVQFGFRVGCLLALEFQILMMKCLDDGWEPAEAAMRVRKTLSLKRGTGSGCWCMVDAFIPNRIVLPRQARHDCRRETLKKRCVFRRIQQRSHTILSTASRELPRCRPRQAFIINPQTMSAVDKMFPAKPALFRRAILPRKTKRSFCQDRLGTNIL
jgi:hypothetical protein